MDSLHPLWDTFGKLNAANPYYTLETGPQTGERWFTLPELFEGTAYDEVAALNLIQQPKASRRYIGSRVLASVAWLSNLAGLGSYFTDQRVPDLSWGNFRLHWREEGWADRLSLVTPRFYALPDDPAIQHKDAIVIADKDALREIFRRQYETNIAAIIEPLKRNSGLGKPAIWGTATDYCVSMITTITREQNRLGTCDSEVAAFVHASGSPLNGKSDVMWIECGDRREPFLDRRACCLWYTVAAEPNSYCSTCPIVPRADRIERLRAHIEKQTS